MGFQGVGVRTPAPPPKDQPMNFNDILENVLVWISAFLGNRKQQLLMDSCMSPIAEVISGIHQGLAHCCFWLINDLPEFIKPSTLRLFADDFLLYKIIDRDANAQSVQKNPQALQEWKRNWQKTFQPET